MSAATGSLFVVDDDSPHTGEQAKKTGKASRIAFRRDARIHRAGVDNPQ